MLPDFDFELDDELPDPDEELFEPEDFESLLLPELSDFLESDSESDLVVSGTPGSDVASVVVVVVVPDCESPQPATEIANTLASKAALKNLPEFIAGRA